MSGRSTVSYKLHVMFELLAPLLQISEAKSLEELRGVLEESWEFLQLAGCSRPVNDLEDKQSLVEDLVSFTMITRMQLPLQRSDLV